MISEWLLRAPQKMVWWSSKRSGMMPVHIHTSAVVDFAAVKFKGYNILNDISNTKKWWYNHSSRGYFVCISQLIILWPFLLPKDDACRPAVGLCRCFSGLRLMPGLWDWILSARLLGLWLVWGRQWAHLPILPLSRYDSYEKPSWFS